MTFLKWLSRFEGEDSSLGDLADDVKRDRSFPTGGYDEIIAHLRYRGAVPEAVEEFERAWRAYQQGRSGE